MAARFQSASRPAVQSTDFWKLNRRVKTRAVLTSTIGTDWSNANVAMAFAVYRPMPGNSRIRAISCGKWPPYRSRRFRRWREDFAPARSNQAPARRVGRWLRQRARALRSQGTAGATYYNKRARWRPGLAGA